jgi:hypothetical protein
MVEDSWFKTSAKIDISCSAFSVLPFITNNICSVSAAVYAKQGDLVKAHIFTNTLYYLWSAYCFIIACLILFSGLRLLNILSRHVDNQPDLCTVNKLKSGAYRIKMIMSISVASLFMFSIIKYVYALFRVNILLNKAVSLAVACFWTYDGTLACMLVGFIIIFKYVIFVS